MNVLESFTSLFSGIIFLKEEDLKEKTYYLDKGGFRETSWERVLQTLGFPRKDGFTIPLNKEKLIYIYIEGIRYNDSPL